MESENTSTYQKAREINLDATRHGTFAEIGAGQEVARWFFHVGGASATVAKTISAYGMAVSDHIYGQTDHYVSRKRLQAMLDREYGLILAQLDKKRGESTSFFAFADTVATRNPSRRQDGHGWMGLRFQHHPKADPSEIMIHVRMLDKEYVREQQALGILGVNLIYGGFYHHESTRNLIQSLMDDLFPERVEIDMIKFSGPSFVGVDNRLMSLQLVELGFTDAAMFTAEGEVVQPAEVLYRKPILIERGNFRPITNTTVDIMECAAAQFLDEHKKDPTGPPVLVMEMSLKNLMTAEIIDHADFLARVDLLGVLGKMVMVSNYGSYYPLAEYLRRYTRESIAFAMGIPNLREIFDEKYYSALDGGILEALGRLFKAGVELYVYPFKNPVTCEVTTVENLKVTPGLDHLYEYCCESLLVRPIRNVDPRRLSISAKEVLAKIKSGDTSGEGLVPERSAQMIKDRGYFGYKPS